MAPNPRSKTSPKMSVPRLPPIKATKETFMSNTGLPVFDKTLQLTHIWLKEVGETIGPDDQRQYHALRSVLFAVQ